MACRGVHFAVTPEQASALADAPDDETLMAQIETLEEAWDIEHLAQSDKAWDAIHRCLTDGQPGFGNGSYPLNHCVLGPRQLHRGEHYIVSLVSPETVRAVALALELITEEWFRSRYSTMVPKDYSPNYGEDDLQYTWDWFQGIRDLYRKASAEGRAVIFTVDQ